MLRLAGVLAAFAAAAGLAAAQQKPPTAHMTIADPATLSGARAEAVYQAIRNQLRGHYAESGDPVAYEYQTWRRFNTVPYRSGPHGKRFVNNYANARAEKAYGQFEKLGTMPQGGIVVKDSFTVTESGQVLTGPFFLMEKKAPGFDPGHRDWLFMMIRPDGTIAGVSGGVGAANVAFCAECHAKAPESHDGLYFMPREVRRTAGAGRR